MSNEVSVSVERLDRAIKITAELMVRHQLPQLMSTLKRLETERDRLLAEGDAINYAKRVLDNRRPEGSQWESVGKESIGAR
jgi:hypothetical protein